MHQEALGDKQKRIFPKLKNFKGFYLAGGTALALQIGHRVSVDFDLFSPENIERNLLSAVRKAFASETIITSVNNPGELTVFIDEVKVTFLKYPFPVLFDFVLHEGISFLSVKEIAATKAYTIGRRGSYKDYVDIFFAVSGGHVALDEIIAFAEKKYRDEFHARLFLEQLLYLDDIDDTEVIFLKKQVTKREIELFFTEEIKKIEL